MDRHDGAGKLMRTPSSSYSATSTGTISPSVPPPPLPLAWVWSVQWFISDDDDKPQKRADNAAAAHGCVVREGVKAGDAPHTNPRMGENEGKTWSPL